MRSPESNLPHARSPLRALTGLRFVAAFWVVLYHFFRPVQLGIPMRGIDSIVQSGFCGVGLFFALSGFVLSYVYGDIDSDHPIAKRNFWGARFARIYDGPDEVHRMTVARRILKQYSNGEPWDFGMQ